MKHYPYIVYRYRHGVYGNATINFVDDERLLSKVTGVTICWEGEIYDDSGEITSECRELLRAFGIKQKEESRFRLCIVYGPNDCDYFETGGVVNQSNQPPSSTITLGDGKYESELGIGEGHLDLKLTKIYDSSNIGAKQSDGKHSLVYAEKLLAILVIVTSFIYSGCLLGRAESYNQQSDKDRPQSDNVNTNRNRTTGNEHGPRKKSPVPTAICRDGSLSYSASRNGTCSHHGGVEKWLIRLQGSRN